MSEIQWLSLVVKWSIGSSKQVSDVSLQRSNVTLISLFQNSPGTFTYWTYESHQWHTYSTWFKLDTLVNIPIEGIRLLDAVCLLLGNRRRARLLQWCGLSLVSSAPKKWRLTRWPVDLFKKEPLKGNSEVHLHTPTSLAKIRQRSRGTYKQTNKQTDRQTLLELEYDDATVRVTADTLRSWNNRNISVFQQTELHEYYDVILEQWAAICHLWISLKFLIPHWFQDVAIMQYHMHCTGVAL